MRLISFGIDPQHAGNFGSLHKELVQHLLPEEVEFVGEYSSEDTGSIVSIFTDYTVQHFCEPPDTCVRGAVYHCDGIGSLLRKWLRTFLYVYGV